VTLPTSVGTDNRFVTYAYTDDNLVASVSSPSPATAGARVTSESYLYDASGRVVKTTDALGLQKTRSYTSDGLQATITNEPNGSITHVQNFTYDANGNAATQMPVPGQTWTNTYYTDNLAHTTTDPAGDQTQYNYDQVGHPIQVFSPSAVAKDANNTSGSPTTSTYTLDGLLNSETTPVSPDGTQTRTTSYTYDLGGRKTSQAVQLTGGTSTSQQVSYYPDDRVQTQTGRNGETITTAYTPSGNARTITDSTSSSTLSATYYLDGLLRSADDGSQTSQFTYDGLDQRSARSDLVDGTTTSYPATYTYNDAEILQEIAAPILGSFFFNQTPGYLDYTYDAAGRPQSQLYGVGTQPKSQYSTSLTWSFNPDNTLAEQQVPGPTGSAGPPMSDWRYAYDSSYRLSTANFTGLDVFTPGIAITRALSYTYDAAGRVASYNDGSGARSVTFDHDNNRLTYGSQSFSYNADNSLRQTGTAYFGFGGLQSDTCSTYAYDGFDRLQSVTPTGASGCSTSLKAITYSYDGLDRQRSAATTSATTDMHYDGLSQVVSVETNSAGSTVPYVLEPSGQHAALHYWTSGFDNVQFLDGDGRGNISTVWENTSSGAAPDCQIFFDPWGTPMAPGTPASPCSEGSTPNNYFYKGARLDSSTGDFEMGSRTYDPGKAAFLTPDTTRTAQSGGAQSVGTDPLTENRYSYVNGDPVNLVDPEGHSPFDFLGGAVSSAVSAVGSFASSVWSGIQQVASDVWGGITSFASDVWSGATSAASTVEGAVSSTYNAAVSSVQSDFSSLQQQLQASEAALQQSEQRFQALQAEIAQAQQQAAAAAQQTAAYLQQGAAWAQQANIPKAVAGVNPFGAFQAVGGAASTAAGWFDAHASQIKSVAQGVGTACGLVSLIGVADMVTVPCLLVANGVALAADIDLAVHGQQGWDAVGMDVLGAGASAVGAGAVIGGGAKLAEESGQVAYGSTELSQYVQEVRVGMNDSRGNFAAARLEDGEILLGRSNADMHAEEDILSQAGGRRITDLYTERQPCAACAKQIQEGTSVTWSFAWNADKAVQKASNAALRTAIRGLFNG
jgi:RHS repeat-associated protein